MFAYYQKQRTIFICCSCKVLFEDYSLGAAIGYVPIAWMGESLAYVRNQLGHSSIQNTVDTHGHLVPGSNRQAVDRLDDLQPSATKM